MKTTLAICIGLAGLALAEETVIEPAKTLPLVQDVDVVVVGGSSGAVSAACRAAKEGASVFLISSRPYLGEDMAGKLRLHLDPQDDTRSPILREMFLEATRLERSLPFTYTVNQTAAPQHPDPSFTRLNDGNYLRAPQESVQYSGDVTVTLDLGKAQALSKIVIGGFLRDDPKGGFKTASVTVRGSADKSRWSEPVTGSAWTDVQGGDEAQVLEIPFTGTCRYLEVTGKQAEGFSRQLLGEIFVYPEGTQKVAKRVAEQTRPLKVKKSLDQALLQARIPFLTGAQVCGTVVDTDGNLAGVVMANRNGRQVIRAKVVIDATERGLTARLAGGKATEFPVGTYTFTRTVIAGEAPRAEGVRVKELLGLYPARITGIRASKGQPEEIAGKMFQCEIDITMRDGSARSFAEAEQKARDLTFVPSQLESADTLAFTPPDRILGKHADSGDWKGVDAFDLATLQPAGTEWLFVLSPMADVPRAVTVAMMQPGNLMALGERVGAAAAAMAKSRGKVGAVTVKGTRRAAMTGSVGEHDKGLPAYLTNAKGRIPAEPQELPVLATCDVVVAGAGTGGAPAGIAAARHGAKTIICEYLYQMGGVQTDGLIGLYYWGNRVGFTTEIDAGVKETGLVFSQSKSEWYRKENRKAGTEIWYGTMVNGVVVENNHVTGVVVLTPDGRRGVIRCKAAIDSTGNAELPALAGIETEFITAAELAVQGVGQTPRNLGASYTNTDIGFLDDTDAADLCFFALRSRLSMADNVWDQAQVLNSRERRRMIGAFFMTPLDVVNERTYPDVVVQTFSNFDTHGQTVHEQFFIQDPGHKGMKVNLPYRCFLPKTLEGLLVTGLGISAHRDAMPILRMQPDVQNQGYAAGTAAAMAIKSGVEVRKVDMKALQRHLIEMKILPKEVLTMKDSFPLPDEAFDAAVRDLPNDYQGLSVVLIDYGRSIPRLRNAYRTATDPAAKLVYAHVLGMMGERDGEEELIKKLQEMAWDTGWNYRGMGQFNRSVSWVDSCIIALGRCHSKKALPALIAKTEALTEKSEYSHFRAVALALEAIGDPAAVPALLKALRLPGLSGHAITMGPNLPVVKNYANREGDWERTECLRELCLGRALFHLNDPDGIGRKTMTAYANDPRGAYATHAKLVMGKERHAPNEE
ncbi:MAG: FAD-dependent oxidoreductase [Kiritimatiellae bacterium]|nr:FAD-dependent oxidoreductase [Kiritimatiellia bacterium]